MLVAAIAIAVIAQVAPPAPAPLKAPQVQAPVVFNMAEDVIEASVHGPSDHIVAKGPHVTFRSLIRIRESFSRELLASASQVGP